MSNSVLVLSNTKKPLMPCCPARARELLTKGKAAVYRHQPFTIILKNREDGDVQETELKLDPGSKTTGIAVVSEAKRGNKCLIGINLEHRGQQIRDSLLKRSQQRHSRRHRKIRFRSARFNNRTKPKGWLAPSIKHRVLTTQTWIKRLMKWIPISSIAIEIAKFDTQKMMNPDIQGKEYQEGDLFEYEIKEYLLFKYNHTCQYCKGASKDPILEKEHKIPRSRGGSNKLSNLTLACRRCNLDKRNKTLAEWVEHLTFFKGKLNHIRIPNIKKVIKEANGSLKDAAVMNAVRYRIGELCKTLGIPVSFSFGAKTKFNRSKQKYRKDHWIDAACVGLSGESVYISEDHSCLTVKCMGHGSRRMVRPDKNGFPSTKPKGFSTAFGFSTGDLVRFRNSILRIAIRTDGIFDGDDKRFSYKKCKLIQKNDGYKYSFGTKIKMTFILDLEQSIKSIISNFKKFFIESIITNTDNIILKMVIIE